MIVPVKQSKLCLIQRIWPRIEDCPYKEQGVAVPVCASKVNTKNTTGEYVSE